MSASIKGREMLKQKEILDSVDEDCSSIGCSDQKESEIKWVKLHQMFDR